MQDESSPVGTSAADSVAQYSAPPAPVVCPFPLGRRRPTLPLSLSLSLPRFAAQNVAQDNVQSLSVATQLYPSSPRSRSPTPCFVWPILTRSVSGLPCPAPQCPMLHRWYRWYRWTRCLRVLWTGDCSVTGAQRYCHGFGYIYYYKPVLATQPTGVIGIYGECRPGGR